MHGDRRRAQRCFVHLPGFQGRGGCGHDDRRSSGELAACPCSREGCLSAAAPAAGGICRARCHPVRLLHPGLHLAGQDLARCQSCPQRRRDQALSEGHLLSLHGLCFDSERGQGGGREDAHRPHAGAIAARTSRTAGPDRPGVAAAGCGRQGHRAGPLHRRLPFCWHAARCHAAQRTPSCPDPGHRQCCGHGAAGCALRVDTAGHSRRAAPWSGRVRLAGLCRRPVPGPLCRGSDRAGRRRQRRPGPCGPCAPSGRV